MAAHPYPMYSSYNLKQQPAETDGTMIILRLKGAAVELLETMPTSRRNNYNELMVALQYKFGDEFGKRAIASLCNGTREIGAARIPRRKSPIDRQL